LTDCKLFLPEGCALKRLFCLTAVGGLLATTAFGQEPVDRDYRQLGTNVYFRSSAADADSSALADMVNRELEKSRYLHIVSAPGEHTIEVQAPVSMIKEADGKRVKVSYEVTPPDGDNAQTYTTTCTTTQLDRCAEAIVIRTERLAREAKALVGQSDG
jgi:hypothetical protein